MKSLNDILIETSGLMLTIESDYPELYHLLEENPLSVPAQKSPIIDIAIMTDYLEGLKVQLKHHIKSHMQWAK